MTVKHDELVLVIDFGAQYSQLIARRVRECGVYSEIIPYHASLAEIAAKKPKGIIFSGGPNSVYGEKAPHSDPGIYSLGVPVLGICYGMQLMALQLGGDLGDLPERHAERLGEADHAGGGGVALGEDLVGIAAALDPCFRRQQPLADVEADGVRAEPRPRREFADQHGCTP